MTPPNERPKIRTWIRFLAAIYMACISIVVYCALEQLMQDSTAFFQKYRLINFEFLLHSYLTFLFGYVAVTGNSPSRFFPFSSLSWPLLNEHNRGLLRKFCLGEPQKK